MWGCTRASWTAQAGRGLPVSPGARRFGPLAPWQHYCLTAWPSQRTSVPPAYVGTPRHPLPPIARLPCRLHPLSQPCHHATTPSSRLGAQLARTEEAAKRALVQTDATAKGGAAQKLLDAERAIAKLRAENAELASKLARYSRGRFRDAVGCL